MGSSEKDTAPKPAAAAQEQETPPPAAATAADASGPAQTAAVYPDWAGFQAYSPVPPHGYFHSPVVSSPQGHPYMWGAQSLVPPYGTPPPPYVMYPPGAIYTHPSMPQGVAQGGVEAESKSSESKERGPIKRSKGSLGSLNMITGKTNELGKTSGTSANGAYSQSGESGSEGSGDSDDNSHNDSQHKAGSGQDSLDETAQNGSSTRGIENGLTLASSQGIPNQALAMLPVPVVGTPAVATGPTTNLNIGMDYWGTPTPSTIVRGKVHANAVAGRESMPSEPWLQDERELKRQRRKQSNRESARRSRLRKQAECEELALRVDTLKEENTTLRAEVERITKEHDQLLAQNTALKERLAGVGEEARVEKTDDEPGGAENHMESDAQVGETNTAQSGR